MNKTITNVLIGAVIGAVLGFAAWYGMRSIGAPPLPSAIVGLSLGGFILYICANLAGNRKSAPADPALLADSMAFSPPAGKSAVYVLRQGFVAKLAGLDIAVDGRKVAQIKSPAFTRVLVKPGSHELTFALGGFAKVQSDASAVTVDAPDGGVVIIQITMAMGMVKGSVVAKVAHDLEGAKAVVRQLKMTQPDVAEV